MSVVLKSTGGGQVTLQEPVVAGSTVLDLPATNGTILTSASTIPSSQLTNAGLVRVTSGTLSGASGITVDSIFTSTYKNYYIYINATHSTGGSDTDLYFQFRTGGVTRGSNYAYQTNYINAAVNAGTAFASVGDAGSFIIYDNMDNGSIFNGWFQILDPQTAGKSTAQWFLYGEDNGNYKQMLGFGIQTQSVSFDGFTLTMSQGTLTGTYDVYGVAR